MKWMDMIVDNAKKAALARDLAAVEPDPMYREQLLRYAQKAERASSTARTTRPSSKEGSDVPLSRGAAERLM
jgi:hypothetical protein